MGGRGRVNYTDYKINAASDKRQDSVFPSPPLHFRPLSLSLFTAKGRKSEKRDTSPVKTSKVAGVPSPLGKNNGRLVTTHHCHGDPPGVRKTRGPGNTRERERERGRGGGGGGGVLAWLR